MSETIVLIHGVWMTPLSWENRADSALEWSTSGAVAH